jgi:two-component system response regulator
VTKVVFLVEDNPSDEKLTLLAFKNCGVQNQIVVERDGAAALDSLFGTGKYAARGAIALPAVILLDLKLPKIDGLDVLREIRKNPRTRLVPVVVLTSSKQDDDMSRSYTLGANAYLRKPVDFAVFADAARTLAHFWLVLNETAPTPPNSP